MGISPLGPQALAAADVVRSWTAELPFAPWVEGAADANRLHSIVVKWLEIVVNYHRSATTPTAPLRREVALRDNQRQFGSNQ
jgi:hypothetical protein